MLAIGSDVHTSVYDKHDDFGFPKVNNPWLSGDAPRLPSYGIYISQFVRIAMSCDSEGSGRYRVRIPLWARIFHFVTLA